MSISIIQDDGLTVSVAFFGMSISQSLKAALRSAQSSLAESRMCATSSSLGLTEDAGDHLWWIRTRKERDWSSREREAETDENTKGWSGKACILALSLARHRHGEEDAFRHTKRVAIRVHAHAHVLTLECSMSQRRSAWPGRWVAYVLCALP